MDDFSIILQGRIDKESMDFWKKNFKDSTNIIVSVWEDDIQYRFPKAWKVIKTPKPTKRIGFGNFDLQLISTLKGLECVDTKWVVKLRCDEYWSNMDLIYNEIVSNEDMVVCGSFFFKEIGMHPFAISDHIIGGKTDKIKLMFGTAYNNIKNGFWNLPIPESQLGLAYLWESEIGLKDRIKDINLYNSLHPNPTPFSSDKAKSDINRSINQIEVFTNRIRRELDNPYMEWKTIKEWNKIMGYSIEDIKRSLEKSEYPNIDEKELMRKHFTILDVNRLKPYRGTAIQNDGSRMWFNSNFDNYLCITTI